MSRAGTFAVGKSPDGRKRVAPEMPSDDSRHPASLDARGRQRARVVLRQHVRVAEHRPSNRRRRIDILRELPGKAAEQVVRVSDGAGDRGRVGAVRDVELRHNELIGQDQAGIGQRGGPRRIENRQ